MTKDDWLGLWPMSIPLAFLLFMLWVSWQSGQWWAPEFVFTNTQATIRGVVDTTIPPEQQRYFYTYVVRDPDPCRLSHEPNCRGWISMGAGMSIYAVRLGKDDGGGYIGMVVRRGVKMEDGDKVVCSFRKMYYPHRDKSSYSFWMECQLQDSKERRIPPVHECYASEKGGWVSQCPDLDLVQKKPKLVYEY